MRAEREERSVFFMGVANAVPVHPRCKRGRVGVVAEEEQGI
jgi:hypothetical protein